MSVGNGDRRVDRVSGRRRKIKETEDKKGTLG